MLLFYFILLYTHNSPNWRYFLSRSIKSVASRHTCGDSLLKKGAQSGELILRRKKKGDFRAKIWAVDRLLAIFRPQEKTLLDGPMAINHLNSHTTCKK
jgi:hypothetical protein